MKIRFTVLAIAFLSVGVARAQDPAYTNSVGMQFVLIRPGTMQVGVFQPTCPPRNQQSGQGLAPGAGSGQNPGGVTSGAAQASDAPPSGGPQPAVPVGSPAAGRGPGVLKIPETNGPMRTMRDVTRSLRRNRALDFP